MSNEQKNDQKQQKSPLDQVLGQLKESTSKSALSNLKAAIEEWSKAREIEAKTKQKVIDAIEGAKETDAMFAEIKSELKEVLK